MKEYLLDIYLDNDADQILLLGDDDANSWAGDKSQAVDTPRPSPYTKTASTIGEHEGEAQKCNMAEVSYHNRMAKLTWMRAFGLKARSKLSWQTFCDVAELLKYAWHEHRPGSMTWVRKVQGSKCVRFTGCEGRTLFEV